MASSFLTAIFIFYPSGLRPVNGPLRNVTLCFTALDTEQLTSASRKAKREFSAVPLSGT